MYIYIYLQMCIQTFVYCIYETIYNYRCVWDHVIGVCGIMAFTNSEMLCCFRRWDLRCCHYPHSAQSFVAVNAMLARVFIRGFALRTTHSICTCGCRDRASTTNAATVLPTLPLSVLSLNATSAQPPILVKFSRHVLSGLWSHR